MDYQTARTQIQDGDLIAVKGSGVLPWLIEKLTVSPYSHTAVAIWLDGGLWASQMNGGGNNLVPVSQFEKFDVFECPVDRIAVRMFLLEQLRTRIHYSFLDLVSAGLSTLLHLEFPSSHTGLICSEASTLTYTENNWTIKPPKIPTPKWLASQLSLKLQVG